MERYRLMRCVIMTLPIAVATSAMAQQTCTQWAIADSQASWAGELHKGSDKQAVCEAFSEAKAAYEDSRYSGMVRVRAGTLDAYYPKNGMGHLVPYGSCRFQTEFKPNGGNSWSLHGTWIEPWSNAGQGACPVPWYFTKPPQKSLGQPQQCHAAAGNPCDASTGNKYQREMDLSTGLPLERHYNSRLSSNFGLGVGWTSSVHARVEIIDASTVTTRDPDGRGVTFSKNASGQWVTDADSRLRLTQDAAGYTLVRETGITLRFDTAGRVTSEQDLWGRITTYGYDSAGQLVSVVDPFGKTLLLAYTASGLIDFITDPAGAVIDYSYSQLPLESAYRAEVIADLPSGYWRLNDTSTGSALQEFGIGGAGTMPDSQLQISPGQVLVASPSHLTLRAMER